ncbi:peptide chain release factor 2 [Candidatus Peregrinibacteria bacterium]|nr:peptide chain release factor 2 [Candidatus Peregrinibacteria bacterium]
MIEELKKKLETFLQEIKKAKTFFNEQSVKNRIQELEYLTSQPDFWANPEEAKNIGRELAEKKEDLEMWQSLERDTLDALTLIELIHPGKDINEEKDMTQNVEDIEKRFNKANIKLFLNGKYDTSNAIISFHAGTGGLDAQDWAFKLMKMYLKYAENHRFKSTILTESRGEEAGIKSATILIEGPYAYGYLKYEHGIHRLVRLSPFNAGNTRETSFALVEVVPEIEEQEDTEITKEDLRIDTFRSSGPGGQNVNKTDTAVRITHLPTGLVVACQSERSQHQNKERAMKVLKGKLVQMKQEMEVETLEELKGKHKEMSWGNQIRSYVLHPYTMVKDHRTGCETSQVEKVLEGEIDEFIEASLVQSQKEKK